MSLTPQEQFREFIERSKEPLIILPPSPSGDQVGSAWALYFFLKNKGKKSQIAFSNNLSAKFDFLEKPERIMTEISGARDFVLSFDVSQNKIKNIRTEEKENKFNIYLTPEKGSIDPRDFSFILAKFKYDLLIVVGSQDLEGLGDIYEKNTDLFYEVPVINIDHRSNNENFGQINLIDVTASSCAEIIFEILHQEENSVNENIAKALLTGIISATDSFQKKNTTPRSFVVASSLMDKGADQQEIIRWLYKTQPLHILKLWGKAMAKIRWNEKLKLIWSTLSIEDFVQSRASSSDITTILEKLEENYSEGRLFMIGYKDTPDSSTLILKTTNTELTQKLAPAISGKAKRDFIIIKKEQPDMEIAAQEVIGKISQIATP